MPDLRRGTDEADVTVVGKTKINAGEKAGKTRAGSSLDCRGFSDYMHLNRSPQYYYLCSLSCDAS